MEEIEKAAVECERALRKSLRICIRTREIAQNAIRFNPGDDAALTKSMSEIQKLGRVESYITRALSTLPDGLNPRLLALCEHLDSVTTLCED